MNQTIIHRIVIILLCGIMVACATDGVVVRVIDVGEDDVADIDQTDLERLKKIKAAEENDNNGLGLNNVIASTPSFDIASYLMRDPDANNPAARDYTVGGYDRLDITVYEEADLSREEIPVSADGYISFPLINRVAVSGLSTTEIADKISSLLAQGQFLIDAHVSVMVSQYRSKQYMVLGPIKLPGSYPLEAHERVLDAISNAGGLIEDQAGQELMIIRTENPNTTDERKLVIRINLQALLNQGDQLSNILLQDKDLIYIAKAERFYILGQVQQPGSFFYVDKKITLVEAIGMAGGFTRIAARNRTRIVRMQGDAEKIIEVKVDAITKAGKKAQDVPILPGDVIIVPESFF